MTRFVVVTGTDTGVGKTVATAALAVRAEALGSVCVVKPAQTGIADHGRSSDALGRSSDVETSDADEVQRLTGCPTHELTRLPDPLAPDSAARLRGVPIPPVSTYVDRVRELGRSVDTVIIEGAGGLLVRLDTEGGTLLDLAVALRAEVYVVCRAALGTLNHTELTVAALRGRGVEPAGLVIGSWPRTPGLAETCNREDLPRVTGAPLVGVIPEGVGVLDRTEFRLHSPTWILPDVPVAHRA